MKSFILPAAALLLLACAAIQPALAQSNAGAGGNPGGLRNPNKLTPRPGAPDILPPAIPGIGTPSLATGPVLHKPIVGDPTVALFTAVNNGDYNMAQDAIGRGADLNAQNNLGETALDLAIALNRNSITFLLLSTRNAGGGGPPAGTTNVASVPLPGAPAAPTRPSHTVRARMTTLPSPHRSATASTSATANPSGTPDPAAGFLGFGPAK